ncbi:radical SAM protein [Limibacterium fermenti]|uniref:radical SAM protein n=1 Tax=Limibacterium fermenti TaxID=3229863 RepID=UPI003A6491DF
MKLRNLMYIQEKGIRIIGLLTPPFFCRVSDIMSEFIQLCEVNNIENSMVILKEKYPLSVFQEFQQRLNKVKDKFFVDDTYKEYIQIDLSQKVSTLTLNVTRKCNLKCSYCFEDSEYRKLEDMSFDIAKKAIDTFFTDNSTDWVIIFTGGEPLLNFKLLKQVAAYINSKELKVEYRIKTNATLINNEKTDFLIRNNFKIQISLDGNKEAHDTHRKFTNGKGSFAIVDKVIKNFIANGYGSLVSLSGTLTNQTIQYVDNCYNHLNSYVGIYNYSLKPVMPNSHEGYAFDLKDYRKSYIANLKHNRYLKEVQSKVFEKITKKEIYNVCGIGIWNITIDVDGKIYPCYRMCGNEEYVIGSLDSLTLPLNLPQDLKKIYCLEENNEQCSKCYLIDICKTGCYTDKLMYKCMEQQCFQPTKLVIEDLIKKEFIDKKIYLSLDIV